MPDEWRGKSISIGNQSEIAALPELSPGLLQAIGNTDVSVAYEDAEQRILWSLNIPTPWSRNPFGGTLDREILSDDGASTLLEARQRVRATGASVAAELQVRDGSALRWFDIWIDADRDGGGNLVGLVTTAVETTDHKRREQTLRALLREVSHRSKNLLAIILSIAGQTGRYSGTIETFLVRFRGRVQSLASSQDLVTHSDWRGADLHQLVKSQTGRYCTDPHKSIRLTGESPYLNPNAALYVGLALHELAVNSVSFGALARPDGSVEVDVHAAAALDRAGIEVVWSENIRPRAAGSDERRFGSIALERVVPAALDGSASLLLGPDRLEYRLFIPESNYEIA